MEWTSLTGAAVVVDVERESLHDVVKPLPEDGVRQGALERVDEDLQEGLQRVLVHGVHHRHVGQHEEQDRSTHGGRPVAVPGLLDVHGSARGQVQFVGHL